MRIKRICACFLVMSMIFQPLLKSVFAAEPERVIVNAPRVLGNVITITGKVPASATDNTVTIQIIKPNGVIGTLNDVFHLYEIESNENGTFEYTLNMNDMAQGGWYTVYAGAPGCLVSELTLKENSTEYIQSYYYVSQNDRNGAVELVNDCVAISDVRVLLDGSTKRLEFLSIGMLMDEYDAFSETQKKAVCASIHNKNFANDTLLCTAFNDKVISEIFKAYGQNVDSALDALKSYSYYTGFDLDKYDSIQSQDDVNLFGRIMYAYNSGQWSSVAQIKEAYSSAFALMELYKESNYENVWGLLEKHAEIFKLETADLNEYKALTSSKARQYVLMTMCNRGFLTVPEVKNAFHGAIVEAKNIENKPSSNPIMGGGGSGGGAGGAASKVTFPISNNSYKNEQAEAYVFADMTEKHWAYDYVMDLYNKGIVNGNDAKRFEPDSTLTREIFVKMLTLAFDVPKSNVSAAFTDVPYDAWYAPYISDAKSFGIVNGISDKVFGVGQPITRQDMAVMIVRAVQKTDIKIDNKEATMFADDSDIAVYAKNAVYLLKGIGVINGIDETHYEPNGYSTKAQAAKVISCLMQMN